jgi:two-component system chemotaxis response regulator CheY
MKRVMIVDHSSVMRNRLKSIVLRQKHQVVAEAMNGKEAVLQYMLHKPDLVIMDIVIPVMNGLVATKVILDHDPAAKIIVCSAIGHKKVIMEMIEAGVSDFVVKPFLEEHIVMALENQFQSF